MMFCFMNLISVHIRSLYEQFPKDPQEVMKILNILLAKGTEYITHKTTGQIQYNNKKSSFIVCTINMLPLCLKHHNKLQNVVLFFWNLMRLLCKIIKLQSVMGVGRLGSHEFIYKKKRIALSVLYISLAVFKWYTYVFMPSVMELFFNIYFA